MSLTAVYFVGKNLKIPVMMPATGIQWDNVIHMLNHSRLYGDQHGPVVYHFLYSLAVLGVEQLSHSRLAAFEGRIAFGPILLSPLSNSGAYSLLRPFSVLRALTLIVVRVFYFPELVFLGYPSFVFLIPLRQIAPMSKPVFIPPFTRPDSSPQSVPCSPRLSY